MKIIEAEGFRERYTRHTALGKAIRSALRSYGMSILAKEEVAAPTLSCILYPSGLEDSKFRAALADKGLIVAGALGPLAGKGFRLGHMGNTSNHTFIQALRVIGETLEEQTGKVDINKAIEIFKSVFEEYNRT